MFSSKSLKVLFSLYYVCNATENEALIFVYVGGRDLNPFIMAEVVPAPFTEHLALRGSTTLVGSTSPYMLGRFWVPCCGLVALSVLIPYVFIAATL